MQNTLKGILFFALILFTFFADAQTKEVQHLSQIWTGYLNTTRLSNHWGITAEFQFKTHESFFNNTDLVEKSIGAIYFTNDKNNTRITGAFTLIDQYPSDGKTIIVPEYRPWQMIQWNSNVGKTRCMQWVRLEERFKRKVIDNNTLGNNYDFSYRLRYNVLAQLPITKHKFEKGAVSLACSNELYLNLGDNIVYNVFDQNRFFIGGFYYLNTHDFIQFGYLKSYQQLSSGYKFKAIDVIKLSFFNNLDFRKKINQKKA